MAGDCEDGRVRLVDGNTDEQNLTMDGRLEICFNNAWGTVCNTSFRVIDAQVACDQLIGFARDGSFVRIVQEAVVYVMNSRPSFLPPPPKINNHVRKIL